MAPHMYTSRHPQPSEFGHEDGPLVLVHEGAGAPGSPTTHILRGQPMDTVHDAARQACRAWFTSEPMGQVMSDLADQLASIDKGQTHGADSTSRERADGQAYEATGIRVGRFVQADGKASENGG